MNIVTLYDILTLVNPGQKLYIYYENAYDQYVCLYRGRRIDMKFDKAITWPGETVFKHLGDTVSRIEADIDNKLRVFIRNEEYNMRLEESYNIKADNWCHYKDLLKKFEWI